MRKLSERFGLPVAPSLAPLLRFIGSPRARGPIGRRVVALSGVAIAIGVSAAAVAHLLGQSIALITNLAFYGELSLADRSPAGNSLGVWVMLVPVVGALIVGVMARYGSAAIRGHGIPEAMEQVLFNQSKIPARVLLLPLRVRRADLLLMALARVLMACEGLVREALLWVGALVFVVPALRGAVRLAHRHVGDRLHPGPRRGVPRLEPAPVPCACWR